MSTASRNPVSEPSLEAQVEENEQACAHGSSSQVTFVIVICTMFYLTLIQINRPGLQVQSQSRRRGKNPRASQALLTQCLEAGGDDGEGP